MCGGGGGIKFQKQSLSPPEIKDQAAEGESGRQVLALLTMCNLRATLSGRRRSQLAQVAPGQPYLAVTLVMEVRLRGIMIKSKTGMPWCVGHVGHEGNVEPCGVCVCVGLKGQVWTRHQAPTAPATRPSSLTQFHLYACLRDSPIQFIFLTSVWGGGGGCRAKRARGC